MSIPKITTLMEDTLYDSGLEAEHGLSLYIETEKHKLLADTGQTAKTWTNASAKNINITKKLRRNSGVICEYCYWTGNSCKP